jgi:Clp amino terminal domain, pathogenicity island component
MDASRIALGDLIKAVERQCSGPPLERLTEAVGLSQRLTSLSDELVEHFVQAAREDGASWSQIGANLGVTRQAAHQRHTGPKGMLRRHRGSGSRGPFTRLTPAGREVVVQAQAEAGRLGHNYLGTEHLLLGLFHQRHGISAQVLGDLGLTVDGVRGEIRARIGEGTGPVTGRIPFTPRAKKVLELALREARHLGHDPIDTEHLLLGLIREPDGVAAEILRDAEVRPDDVRARVLRLRSERH